jgi:hypothetical protein
MMKVKKKKKKKTQWQIHVKLANNKANALDI